jgi:hypothetical protein
LFLAAFSACSDSRVYLEAPEASYSNVAAADNPVYIRYFFDRTMSMRGFVNVADSAYIRIIPRIWEVGDSLWSATNNTYYVYGDIQIGTLGRHVIASRERGLRVPALYGGAPICNRVRPGNNRPFYSVNNYIHDTIDPNVKSLHVVISNFHETDSPAVFFRFFRDTFAKNLSAALFAVESEFNGVKYDIYDNKRPFPGPGTTTTTGEIISTFFILVIGSRQEVLLYSERLFSEFTGMGISFNHTAFLLGPAERVSPEPTESLTVQDIRRFESEDARFSMVNLRRPLPDNRQLGIFQWEGGRRVPADVEAYQMLTRVGARYAAGLTDRAFDEGFRHNVALQVRYHEGEGGRVGPGEVTGFRDYRAANEHFSFQAMTNPDVAEGESFFRRLYLIGETRNLSAFATGYYEIRYFVQAEAVVPDWVRRKSADSISEFEEMFRGGERLGVLGLYRVYSDIIGAYNRSANRLAWSGELYLVRRR